MADVIARRGALADAEALRAIRLEALRDTPEAYGSTYAEAITFGDERWREMAESRPFFLGECADVVVGMASGGPHHDRPETHWLFGMYVAPRMRGTGLAVALVDEVGDWARADGAGELYLHVNPSLVRAVAFYEKVGFAPTGGCHTMGRDPAIQLLTMVRPLD